MSTLVTHALVGVLLALAVRLPAKYVPAAAFLAVLPDLEKLPYFILDGQPLYYGGRAVLHNVFFCVLLPLLVYGWLWVSEAPSAWRRFVLAAPLLMGSHVLLDMIALEPYGSAGRVALLWPFTDAWFVLATVHARAMDPTTFSTWTLLVGILTAGVVLTLAAQWYLEPDAAPAAGRRSRRHAWAVFSTYAVVWTLLVPVLFASGVVSAEPAMNAKLADVEAVPGDAGVTVRGSLAHVGGNPVPQGALVLEVRHQGALVAVLQNPETLHPGSAWHVDTLALVDVEDGDVLDVRAVVVTLVGRHEVARADVLVDAAA